MDDNESIRAFEIRRFAQALDAMSRAYGSLADWMESQEIQEIPGAGTETAKRGLRYLGGFTGAVLKSYARALLGGDGESAPASVAFELSRGEAMAKDAGKERRDPIAENLSNTRGRQDEIPPVDGPDATLARIQSRKKKRES